MTADLFERLAQKLGIEPRSDGELHVECPNCGKPPKPGQTHFSIYRRDGESFGHCFVCGFSAGPQKLAKLYLDGETPAPTSRPKRKQSASTPKRYWWQDHPSDTLARMTRLSVDERLAHWQRYKPITRAMVERYQLGYGTLPLMESWRGGFRPASKCTHDRLLVPLFEDGHLVGVRGRAIDCDCGKWLSPAGNKAVLYNAEALTPGCTVVIVENAIDALLLTHVTAPHIIGVATLSVSYLLPRGDTWTRPGWIAQLHAARPKGILVWYDNHRPGNGNGKREWLAEHKTDIMPNGVKLVNGLLREGFDARLYDWKGGEHGQDVGDIIAQLV